MLPRSLSRTISAVTIFVFFAVTTVPPAYCFSAEEAGKWIKDFPKRFVRRLKNPDKKITSPEQLEEIFSQVKAETFNGNPTQRDAKSDWKRPAKQVSMSILDGQIGIIRQFLAFQAANTLYETAKKAGRTQAWQTARQVVSRMGGDSAQVLNATLAHSTFGRKLFALLGSKGFKSALLREGNFVVMALIAVLINSGIYDGLDVDSMKDRVLAIAPLCTDWTYPKGMPAELMVQFINRQLYSGFNGYFDAVYKKALNSKSAWSAALRGLDAKANELGRKLFKATRLGVQNSNEQNVAKKLGLVGVGEGVQFTLSGLFQRLAVGGAFAVGGQLLLDSTYALARGFQDRTYLGGNRNRYWVRQDLNDFQYQKTGKKWKDALRERYIRLRSVFYTRVKWPIRSTVVPVTGLLGGYFGSVLAGALFVSGGPLTLIGGTLVSSLMAGLGTFAGNWAATKLDRSPFMMKLRRRNYIRRITREIKEMPIYKEGRIDDAQVAEIARARALDFEKIEKVGQVSKCILIVDSPSNILMGKKGDYWKMIIPDEHGSKFEANADIRYDIIDLEGNRWVYDIHSNKIRNVGKVADNNGRFIVFVNSKGVLVENDTILNRGKDDPERTLHIFDNGVILEKRGDEWIVRGQGSDRDIFFRDTGERFEWRDGAFRRANGPGDVKAPSAPGASDPLDVYAKDIRECRDEQLAAETARLIRNRTGEIHRRIYDAIDALSSFDDLASRLSVAAVGLGLVENGDDELPHGFSVAHTDMIKTLLKGKVDRFIEKRLDALVESVSTSQPRQLREDYERARRDIPLSGDRYRAIARRAEDIPVWGDATVLGDCDAVLAYSVYGGD